MAKPSKKQQPGVERGTSDTPGKNAPPASIPGRDRRKRPPTSLGRIPPRISDLNRSHPASGEAVLSVFIVER